MATGFSTYTANAILDAIGNATPFSVTTLYIQLHTADPGANGTTAVAGNATRKAVSFSAAASGAITNDTDVAWNSGEVDTSEDYTHYSLHDASSSGNFIGSGVMTANAVVTGDTFTIPAGDLDLSVPRAS